jgi:hypothetical protein
MLPVSVVTEAALDPLETTDCVHVFLDEDVLEAAVLLTADSELLDCNGLEPGESRLLIGSPPGGTPVSFVNGLGSLAISRSCRALMVIPDIMVKISCVQRKRARPRSVFLIIMQVLPTASPSPNDQGTLVRPRHLREGPPRSELLCNL